MIRITIELLPFGNQEEKQVLSVIDVSQIGKVSKHKYTYSYKGFVSDFNNIANKFEGIVHHNRTENVLKLLAIVLASALAKSDPEDTEQ